MRSVQFCPLYTTQNCTLPLDIFCCLRYPFRCFQVLFGIFAVWMAFPHALYNALGATACPVALHHDMKVRRLVCAGRYPLAVVYALFRTDKAFPAALALWLVITHFAVPLDRKSVV